MAGFLDKQSRIIDMVLTGYGKEQLSKGQLEFVYWSAFDDEVDYSPYISDSGSLTAAQLSSSITQQIEECLVREATTGYKHLDQNSRDTTNVNLPLFDMPQGQRYIPRANICLDVDNLEIKTKQRKIVEVFSKRDQNGNVVEQIGPIDRGTSRFDPETVELKLQYRLGDFSTEHKFEGFKITVFQSGSDGLREIDGRRDFSNDLSFNNDLKYDGED